MTVKPRDSAEWIGEEYNAERDEEKGDDEEDEDGHCDEVYVYYDIDELCADLRTNHFIELIVDDKGPRFTARAM